MIVFTANWGYSQAILEFKKAKFSMFEGFYKMFLVMAFLLTFFVKIKVNYVQYIFLLLPFLTAAFLKLVQRQSQLNREIHPFVVEGICFTHT